MEAQSLVSVWCRCRRRRRRLRLGSCRCGLSSLFHRPKPVNIGRTRTEPATVVKQAQLEEAEDEGQATEDQEDEEDEEDVEDDEEDGAHQPTLTCAELLQQLNACHVGLEQARSAASQVRLQQQQLMRDMDGGACRSQLPWAWAEQL
jgi:hypothetical protein